MQHDVLENVYLTRLTFIFFEYADRYSAPIIWQH